MAASAAGPLTVRSSLALALGVAAVSSAAVLISLARAQGAPALSIAALRMCFASLVVVPVACVRSRAEIRRMPAKDVILCIVAGLFLALHFAFWTSSLDSTSVMSSVVFVSTNPLFVGIASALFLRERLAGWTILGICTAAAGAAVIGAADLGAAGGISLKGDLLALLGALCASGYLLVGRRVRSRVSLALYVGVAYLTAAIALLAVVLLTRTPLGGYSPAGFIWIALLAAGPQLIGHTSYNWALRFVTATFVTVTLLAEPVGATLLAIPVLGQVPSVVGLGGAVLILAGIFLSARAESPGSTSMHRNHAGK
jgi:drug/metabolite transporter (DMT)-like permease